MLRLRRIIVMLLVTTLLANTVMSFTCVSASENSFQSELTEKYSDIEIANKTEVRWWLAQGLHTDETLLEEIQAIYDAGFRGVEICQLTDPGNIDESKYAYGSEEWDHDLKLIMNKALDLGLTVSITSGTGWSTANVPGLDPDSQAANQSIFYLTETVKAGASREGAIPTDTNLRSNAKFIGAYAYRKTTGTTFAKDFLPMQTRENASDPEEFTIEGDFIIDKEATAICFGTRNSSKSVWLQINPIYKSGKTYARCFVRGSQNTTTNIDVTSAIGYAGTNIYGKQIHIKIHVKDMTVKVYFGNSDTVAATFTIPSTAAMAANGKFTLGKLMFRQSTSYSYGSNEVARWDNLIVKDGNGNTVFEEDFSDPADTGFESLGLEVVDGMAQVGYFQQPTLGGDKVRKDFYHLQTRENAADPENFVIEGDFKIKSQSTGICFGVRDKNNYVYMQINAVNSSYGAVLLRPHVFNAGALKDRKEIDISNAIGYTASEIIGKTIHIKIAVENGIIKTYFNNSTEPVYTYSVPDTAAFNSEGKFTLGKLMFRHVTNDNYSLEEIALWDNLKVTDENGNVIFEETFDDDDSGFETGDGICVENGTLNLGKKQTVGGGDTIFVADEFINLTDMVENGTLNWTAPYYGDYMIMYYWQQGTAQRVYPAAEPTYCINYFDTRGFESLKTYFEENVLNDAALNEKIKKGDVQMFMDSLEYTNGKGFTMWPETFASEFKSRKGYDVTPYMYLAIGAPTTSIWNWSDNADLIGTYTLTDSELNHKILNDIYDVQTQLYMEKFMVPLREWLNSYGIKLRAQISYGKNLEISKPISVVDYPEAENRNQRNQIDMYRLWSGGAHLQNKVLSSETGGLENSAYTYDYQRHLQESYTLFASGYNRIIWHIWTSSYGSSATTWPGYEGGRSQYYKFGTREPSYTEYNEVNEHLGRIQTLLREGKSGTDIGLLYTKYGQHLVYSNKEDWMKKHKTLFFQSTKLQDNGYTYDYLNPDMLTADGVYFDKDTQTLELAGYKAIVVWQEELDVNGAKALLNYAEQGLKVIIVDGAAVKSPYNDNTESELKTIISDLKSLANVKTASNEDDVLNVLKEMEVVPYVAFESENQQLLSQTRRDGENRYVYLYNYCDGSLHTVNNKTHGDTISTSIIMDGTFIPYYIDAWSGKVEKVEKYTHTDGKTVIPVSLDYGDVALYAFEKTDLPVLREKESEKTILTDKSFEIDSWSLTVESWTEGETITRTDGRSTEYSVSTKKENITVNLDTLATWDGISEIGKEVSGKGYYKSTFNWDGEFDGAFIDFGKIVQSMKVYVNGKKTDNVNLNKPIIDISDLLVVGENEIYIEYSSNLTNVQISRGIVTDGIIPNNYLGYDTTYRSYGISKATVIPYSETGWSIEDGTLTISKDLGNFTAKTAPWCEYASSIKSIVVKDGVKSIGDWAFAYLTKVESVSLPESLETIGTNAFYRCQKLEKVVIPESVYAIKSGAFSYCYALKEINIPTSVTVIESYTFYDCEKLIAAKYEGTDLEWNAILIKKGNENLTNAYPPVTEEKFEWKVENGTLTISGNVTMPDYASKTAPWFAQADSIKAIVIEDGIKSIGKYAFAYLDKAQSVQIADSVTYVAPYAFYGAGLKEINVPESVTEIGNGAFTYCRSLVKVTIPAGVKKIQNYTFYGCNKLATAEYAGDFGNLTINTGNAPLENAGK